MTSQKPTWKEIHLPFDIRMLSFSVQDAVDILLMHEADDDRNEVRLFLENADPDQLYRIGNAIARNIIGARHATEAVVETVLEESRRQLQAYAQGQPIPEPEPREVGEINRLRLHRELIPITIQQMTAQDPNGPRIRELLLQAGVQDQEGLDDAVRETLQAMEPEASGLMDRMARELLPRLERLLAGPETD